MVGRELAGELNLHEDTHLPALYMDRLLCGIVSVSVCVCVSASICVQPRIILLWCPTIHESKQQQPSQQNGSSSGSSSSSSSSSK